MKRHIWILNHYASDTFFDCGGRHYWFAKYLKRLGQFPVVFCCNSIHNGDGYYFQDDSKWHVHQAAEIQVPFVFVKGRSYTGNGLGRILNMIDFYRNVKRAAKEYAKENGNPDVIYASSVHPLTLVAGIQLAKLFHIKCICEIRDLWPESFVSYGFISKCNPILIPMYLFEKKLYEYASKIIFTMEGAYDYIMERGWTKSIPRSKIHYINNGVDLEAFDYNKEQYTVEDEDLNNCEIFKVVYTGSIRRINNLGKLLDVAKRIQNSKIKFLVWGKGEELSILQQRVVEEQIQNVTFKGYIDKRYVPYITSHADLNLVHNNSTPIWRFGASLNKLFDYMAAGKPILTDFTCKYNPVVQCGAGIEVSHPTSEHIAKEIDVFSGMDNKKYKKYCQNARKGAEQYDFKNLTKKLLTIMAEE